MHNQINVVYIGNFDITFLDIDLLVSIELKSFLRCTFHLVGSYS